MPNLYLMVLGGATFIFVLAAIFTWIYTFKYKIFAYRKPLTELNMYQRVHALAMTLLALVSLGWLLTFIYYCAC